jgi:hypothetical protein
MKPTVAHGLNDPAWTHFAWVEVDNHEVTRFLVHTGTIDPLGIPKASLKFQDMVILERFINVNHDITVTHASFPRLLVSGHMATPQA